MFLTSESTCTASGSHLAALDEQGTLLLKQRIDSRPEGFLRIFGELSPAPLSVVFEETYGWSWFADLLQDAGIEERVAHPGDQGDRRVPGQKRRRRGAHARAPDAHASALGRLNCARRGPRAQVPGRARASLKRIGSRLRCQIDALLAEPVSTRRWSHSLALE